MKEMPEGFDVPIRGNHDWDKLLNGSVWLLKIGEDFKSVANFRSNATAVASKRQLKVSIRRADADGGYYLQATPLGGGK